MSTANILSLSSAVSLRAAQVKALQEIENNWDSASVFVVSMPTGVGKSICARAIAAWQGSCNIITPTNLQVTQYLQDNQRVRQELVNFASLSAFLCNTTGRTLDKKPAKSRICADSLGCDGCLSYKEMLERVKAARFHVNNYYSYFVHEMYNKSPILIIDEAHNIIPTLQDLHSYKIWKHKFSYPSPTTEESVVGWMGRMEKWYTATTPVGKLFGRFSNDVRGHFRRHFFDWTSSAYYNGEYKECIKASPFDIRNRPPILWPSSIKKIVLMSATISFKDIEQMGLHQRRVVYIDGESPIPAANRPIIGFAAGHENAISLARGSASGMSDLSSLVTILHRIAAKHPEEKGVIHITYSLAELLKNSHAFEDRWLFHNKDNKREVYENFKKSTSPSVLVASGLYEGMDLPYDFCRWQVVAKVPWPSLGEKHIKCMADEDPAWYAWQALKLVIQACGRSTRYEDDRSVVYITDSSFAGRLWTNHKNLFPRWFVDALHIIGQ